MQLRTQIGFIIGLAVLVWAASLLLLGEALSWRMLAPFGITVTTVTFASLVFVKYGWRGKGFSGWLVERPDLAGTWRCRLTSSFRGSDGVAVEKKVFVVIRQTLTSLSFRLYTDSARSASIAENIAQDGTDLFTLAIAYQNVPNIDHRGHDSEIHYGSALFTHIDYDCTRIEGHYWTDRNTRGSLVLLDRRTKQVANFEEAQALFAELAA